MPGDQEIIESLRDIRIRLGRLEDVTREAATQATTAAVDAKAARDQASKINGRLGRLEDWRRTVDDFIARWSTRVEVEAATLVTKAQGKAVLALLASLTGVLGLIGGYMFRGA